MWSPELEFSLELPYLKGRKSNLDYDSCFMELSCLDLAITVPTAATFDYYSCFMQSYCSDLAIIVPTAATKMQNAPIILNSLGHVLKKITSKINENINMV